MAWEILYLPELQPFLESLAPHELEAVIGATELLKERGPDLGEPFVKIIKNSTFQNMKELRRKCGPKMAIRILFAFDAQRKAVLLIGGNKAEAGWNDWYTENIPIADRLFQDHLDANATKESAKDKAKSKKRSKSRKNRRD